MQLGKKSVIPIVPGVNPEEDSTALDTLYFTDMNRMRFQNGKLRNENGWERVFFANFQRIRGAARTIFSYYNTAGNPITLIGTNACLYAFINGVLTNITPLSSSTTGIPNSLATEYNAGVNVSITTTAGSSIVNLNITHYFNDNDQIAISGVGVAVNGIPAASFNNTFLVNVVDNNDITINTGTNATSSGTVIVNLTWAASYVYVTYVNHGFYKGDRIKIAGATGIANIPAGSINLEQQISNIYSYQTFVFQTNTIATSKVTAAGGAGITIQGQIAAGNADQSASGGYGLGLYGAGLYGVIKTSTSGVTVLPRIWSIDTYGGNVILTPGDPTANNIDNLYIWKNDITIAPTLLSADASAKNVPLSVKWVYVSNSAIVALGSGLVLNQFYAASPGTFDFTTNANTAAFKTQIQQASALISQASSRNRDLLFTEDDVYIAEYVNAPYYWIIRKLFTTDGLIGPKARCEIEDAVFWMGFGDFFVFDGTSVNVLPNNTVKRYIYDNIDYSQSYKFFAQPNVTYNEVRWYVVFQGENESTEPTHVVCYNYKERHFTISNIPRTAAEEPINVTSCPYLVQSQISKTVLTPLSLQSYFFTLGNNPLATTNGSASVTLTFTSNMYLATGDTINISGAIDTGGIVAANINGVRTITGFGSGTLIFTAGAPATSNVVAGGGNAITFGTNYLGLTDTFGIGLDVNESFAINNAQTVGGVAPASINRSNAVVRAINYGNIYQFAITSGVYTTSRETGGGGAFTSVTYTPSPRFFQHECGLNDYNPNYNKKTDPVANQYLPLGWYATTNYAQIGNGDNNMVLYTVYPDSFEAQNAYITINGKLYPQSPVIQKGPYTINSITYKFDVMLIARQRQYTISSPPQYLDEAQTIPNPMIDSSILIGKWIEESKESTPR